MKKSILILLISLLVVITTGLWIYFSKKPLNSGEILQFGVIFIIVLFAVFLGVRRLNGMKQGLPSEDEFSKKLMEKASSRSYYISIWLWLIMMYIGYEKTDHPEKLFGAGILGMAIIFALSWVYYRFKGMKDE